MATLAAPALIDTLRDSQLLEPAQLEELGKTPDVTATEPELLMQCLVELGWLTPFQVDRIKHGKVKDLRLGSYILLDRLGAGGGPAYKARKPGKPAVLALKLIPKARLSSPDAAARFMQEVRISAQLQQPNIEPVAAVGQQGTLYLFTRAFVEGTDLGSVVQSSGLLPIHRACEYVRQAALGLAHAHDKGVAHRRVKPANLILTQANNGAVGSVKLVDVGLAQLSPRPSTPGAADPDGDLYCLGKTLYFLLTGKMPAAADVIWAAPPGASASGPLAGLRPGVPSEVQAVLRKLLSSRPGEGYVHVAEVAQALAPFCQEPKEAVAPAVNGTASPAPAEAAPVAFAMPVASAVVANAVTPMAEVPSSPPPLPIETPAPVAQTPVTTVSESVALTPVVATPEPVVLEGVFALTSTVTGRPAEPIVVNGDMGQILGISAWHLELFEDERPTPHAKAVEAPPEVPTVSTPVSATPSALTEPPPLPESVSVSAAETLPPPIEAPLAFGSPVEDMPAPPSSPVPTAEPTMAVQAPAHVPFGQPIEPAAGFTDEPAAYDGGAFDTAASPTAPGRRRARKPLGKKNIMWIIVGAVLHLIAAVILVIAIMAMMKDPEPTTKAQPNRTAPPKQSPKNNKKAPEKAESKPKGDVNPFDE